MKLSEAIRLGAMLHPQCFGTLKLVNFDKQTVKTCALGAAEEAGFSFFGYQDKAGMLDCPVCARHVSVIGGVTHLNDNHRWSREEIAHWVATVESERQPADALATSTNAVREDCESPVLTTRA